MLLLWTWLALILTAVGPARADVLTWSGRVEAGHVVLVEILYQGTDSAGRPVEELAARFLSADGTNRTQAGWRPDIDPLADGVRFEVPELWLGPGDYTKRVTVGDTIEESEYHTRGEPPRVMPARFPSGGTGVRALRFTSGQGHDGWSFAPALGTVAFVPVGEGEWSASVTGPIGDKVSISDISAETTDITFSEGRPPAARPAVVGHGRLVALGLFPVSVVMLGLGLFGAWRARRTPGLPLALGVAVVLAGLSLLEVLPDPSAALLMQGDSYTDPPNSAALVAAIADSIRSLSDVSTTFRFPEGHTWLVVGPSWLGYLPMVPVAWLLDGVAAHNLGVALGVFLLTLTGWGLARALGAGPVPALAAGFGGVMAPYVWNELSTLSLDRSTTYLVPVFFICLERAASRPGWKWPVAAGVALAATLYGQVYYGVYLAVAAPFLVLSRLVGAQPLRRLGRMALIAVVAAVLVVPGLMALRAGTASTVYAGEGQDFRSYVEAEGRSLSQPISQEEAETFVGRHDPIRGDHLRRPTENPLDLMMVAMTNSLREEELFAPSSRFTGHGGYWFVVFASLLLATGAARSGETAAQAGPGGHRGAALRLSLDTLILMVFALGPMLRDIAGNVGGLMPYYAFLVAIPGFEQLKHPDRFVLLAATISTVPVALGLDGLSRRLIKQPGKARLAVATVTTAVVTFVMVTFTLAGRSDTRGFLTLDTREWLQGQYIDLSYEQPQAVPYPRSPALDSVGRGPALFLPLTVPTPEAQYLRALQAQMPMVNDAPHGSTAGGGQASWVEGNALLSRAAWLAGTDRPRRLLEPGSGVDARADLDAAGLKWIVLVRSALAGPELAPALELWMDQTFDRVAEDDDIVVWAVASTGAGNTSPTETP